MSTLNLPKYLSPIIIASQSSMTQHFTPMDGRSHENDKPMKEKPMSFETPDGDDTKPAESEAIAAQDEGHEYPSTAVALTILVSCLFSMFLISLVCSVPLITTLSLVDICLDSC